jgi:patatin-like phospholipase/acyl hydrolase
MPKAIRILSIDGGGILGIIPATVLEYLEKKMGKPIADCFHIVAGTSTGSVLGAGLCRPIDPLSAEEARLQYIKDCPQIFDRSLWRRIESLDGTRDERFDERNLETVLGNTFDSLKLSDIRYTHFMTCAYEMDKRIPILFRSWKAQGKLLKHEKGETQQNQDFYLRDVLWAVTAAPTVFEPARISNMAREKFDLIDAAVFENSPARLALTQARKIYPNNKSFLIVSLGCGSAHHAIPYKKADNWGTAGWVLPIFDVLMYS